MNNVVKKLVGFFLFVFVVCSLCLLDLVDFVGRDFEVDGLVLFLGVGKDVVVELFVSKWWVVVVVLVVKVLFDKEVVDCWKEICFVVLWVV